MIIHDINQTDWAQVTSFELMQNNCGAWIVLVGGTFISHLVQETRVFLEEIDPSPQMATSDYDADKMLRVVLECAASNKIFSLDEVKCAVQNELSDELE